jgi:predicted CXXCH cytochrome family protein
VESGSGSITAPNSPTSEVTGLGEGPNVFRWTISNPPCPDSWDEVTINVTLPVCNLTTSGLTNIVCNNNGTPSDPADDYFTFDLDPQGTDLGASYSVSGDVVQSGLSYGVPTTFDNTFLISNGPLNITITDVSGNCFINQTVNPPATCSNDCVITSAGLTNVFCDYELSVLDDLDDTFSFTIDPIGNNLGNSYTVSGGVSGAGNYGTPLTFSGLLISDGDFDITISDDTTINCDITITVNAPLPCSQNHDFTNCTSCHITHNAPGNNLTNVAGNALLCQSCHNSTGTASGKPLVNGNKAIPGTSGNSHAWDPYQEPAVIHTPGMCWPIMRLTKRRHLQILKCRYGFLVETSFAPPAIINIKMVMPVHHTYV